MALINEMALIREMTIVTKIKRYIYLYIIFNYIIHNFVGTQYMYITILILIMKSNIG